MQEVNVAGPSFPDPGPLGPATPVQRYLLADDLVLPRYARASLGLSRTINPMVSVSAVYAYTRGIWPGSAPTRRPAASGSGGAGFV
jgi:hypothetical protein